MQSFLTARAAELSALARRHGVFGSAAAGAFDDAGSDIDFVVSFVEQPPGGVANAYFSLLEDLQELFGRPVDLIVDRSIRNPWFRQSVDASQRHLPPCSTRRCHVRTLRPLSAAAVFRLMACRGGAGACCEL